MKLKDWRISQKLTLAECGERLGVSDATVSRIERGKNYPDEETIQKVFEATNGAVTLDDWFTRDGQRVPQDTEAA